MNEDHLQKALAAASEAAEDSRQLEQIRAVLIAQAVHQGLQAHQPQPCSHHHPPTPPFDAKKWWTIGGLAIVGGCVACALAMAFAVALVGIAIGATCATACLLILRSLWRDYLNHR
ncbi:hypothetical protein ACFYNZ_15245 [Streptomyces kebangsaanensis]|uniref:DUF3040 domain-containing protein n=1 Tax=Streptomyces kebangsaanensis TaxID=864058 RepID=A0ABW6KSH2_9ACTN